MIMSNEIGMGMVGPIKRTLSTSHRAPKLKIVIQI